MRLRWTAALQAAALLGAPPAEDVDRRLRPALRTRRMCGAAGQRSPGRGIELLIENDQTASAGTLAALQAFFAAAERARPGAWA